MATSRNLFLGYCPKFSSSSHLSESDSSASFDIVSLNPFRFSSEYYDSELALVYYSYRHYSPSLGRFLSRDPIEERGGLNLYACLHNNLLNNADKNGLAKCQVSIALGHGIWSEQRGKDGRTRWSTSRAHKYFLERFRKPGGNLSASEKVLIVACGGNYAQPGFYLTPGLIACCAQKLVDSWKIDDVDYTDKLLIDTVLKRRKKLIAAAKKDARQICCRSDCPFVSIVVEYVDPELEKDLAPYIKQKRIRVICKKGKGKRMKAKILSIFVCLILSTHALWGISKDKWRLLEESGDKNKISSFLSLKCIETFFREDNQSGKEVLATSKEIPVQATCLIQSNFVPSERFQARLKSLFKAVRLEYVRDTCVLWMDLATTTSEDFSFVDFFTSAGQHTFYVKGKFPKPHSFIKATGDFY